MNNKRAFLRDGAAVGEELLPLQVLQQAIAAHRSVFPGTHHSREFAPGNGAGRRGRVERKCDLHGRLMADSRWLMVAEGEDTRIRTQIIGMIEHCPSGSYTYSLEGFDGDAEVDLPQQIAVLTEMSSNGQIMGPLWVTGNIPIERSDGQPFETRNRVTLCNCGLSKIKPLCDGTHRPADLKINT